MSVTAPLRSTVVDIDLDAIASNLVALKTRGGADVIAVVKADAYGHGVEAVAGTARVASAGWFAWRHAGARERHAGA